MSTRKAQISLHEKNVAARIDALQYAIPLMLVTQTLHVPLFQSLFVHKRLCFVYKMILFTLFLKIE